MKIAVALIAVSVVACSSDPTPVGPDPSGASSASSASSSASSSVGGSDGGSQGAGGGLSCDPCESTNGSRIVRRKTVTTSPDGLHSVVDVNPLLPGFYDTTLDSTCAPAQATDGATRCLPGASLTAALNTFSDSQCVNAVTDISQNACSGAPPAFFRHTAYGVGDPCKGAAYRVFRTGSPYAGALYVSAGAGCSATTPQAGHAYFASAGEVQPAEMAPMTVETK